MSARSWRWLALVACCWSAAAIAQEFRDPMRPPAQWSLPQTGVAAPESRGPRLQSIRISARERSAIISGHRMTVGDRLGDTRVLAIERNAVVLEVGGVSQTLKLFPDIGKRIITTPGRRPRR